MVKCIRVDLGDKIQESERVFLKGLDERFLLTPNGEVTYKNSKEALHVFAWEYKGHLFDWKNHPFMMIYADFAWQESEEFYQAVETFLGKNLREGTYKRAILNLAPTFVPDSACQDDSFMYGALRI